MLPPQDLARAYASTGQPVRWTAPSLLLSSLPVTARNNLGRNLATKGPQEAFGKLTDLSLEHMRQVVDYCIRHLVREEPKGIGLELGSGCGLLASVLAARPQVECVLAVEICEVLTNAIISKVAHSILGDKWRKVVPVRGCFDCMELPDRPVDFVTEFHSLHHSGDVAGSLRGTARVLKRSGWVLCLDRCHPNQVTDAQIAAMLSRVYPRAYLITDGYPPDIVLTRGENGEHEYRLREWKQAFHDAGFRIAAQGNLWTPLSVRTAIKGLLSILPQQIRRAFYKTEDASLSASKEWLRQRLARLSGRYVFLPQRFSTAFVLRPSPRS